MDEPTRLLLTVEEAGKTLQAGRSTMYKLLESRQIESVKIGRIRRIPVDALQAYVETLRREAQSSSDRTVA
jgi:excisionase family DNA binding protein